MSYRTATWLAAIAVIAPLALAQQPPGSEAPAPAPGPAPGGADQSSAAERTAPAAAESPDPGQAITERASQLPTTTVIGSRDAVLGLPGSGYFIDTDEIRTHSYDDIHQILRVVPGAYVRQEEGFGLFPNISLRGVDVARSAKITLMEDGVLSAPAPYSAPEAYYSPTAGRMSAVEVLKGSSQVRYGPHITGGVVNYLSTPIPEEASGYLKMLYGTDNDIRVHAHYGQTFDAGAAGRFGYLGELYYRSNDGFKEIDSAPGFNGDDTGFTNVEPMIKLMWEPDSDIYHRFEFKYGYTDRDADETYLGLSEEDFNDDPYRRYAASRFDQINTTQNRSYLRHYMEPSDSFHITSTLYYNDFHRNWYKLHDLRSVDDGLGGTFNSGLAEALAGANGGMGLEALKGDRAATLRVRANNRDYYSYGAQTEPTWLFETGGLEHELKLGMRYHADRIRRFQWDDLYVQDGSGAITSVTRGEPGSQDNRRETAEAVAIHLQDAITFDKLTVTPGVRYEHVWFDVENFNAGTSGGDEIDVLGGGVGVNYDFNNNWTAFGGVYRGFSTPSPGAAVNSGLQEESSLGYELGLRYQTDRRAFSIEAVGFHTHFDDLLVIDNGATGSGIDENVGEVNSAGLELLVKYDPGVAYNWGFSMPNFLSFTYTNAELDGDSTSSDPESLFAGGRDGNQVPYIPEYLLTVGTGLDFRKFGVFLTGSFVDEVFTTANNVETETNSTGDPDARFGKLDSHFVVDLSAYYRLNDQAKLLGGVHNLFEEEYAASRHPHGLRPGAPRFLYMGVEVTF